MIGKHLICSLLTQKCQVYQLSLKNKFGFQVNNCKLDRHHNAQPSVIRQEHQAVDKIKAVILSDGNPFTAEGNQLYNFITKAYTPQGHSTDLKCFARSFMKIILLNVSMETPVIGHQSKKKVEQQNVHVW